MCNKKCYLFLYIPNPRDPMEKFKTTLNIAIFVFLTGFIGLEVWNLIAHFLKH